MRARITAVVILAAFLALSQAVEWELAARQPSGASPLNAGPEGTSDLVRALAGSGFNVSVVRSWSSELKRLKPCLIVAVSPELPYSEVELEAIRELVSSGANILVADEGTNSNEILEHLGIPVRVSGRILLVGGEAIFSATAKVDGVELNVTYAFSSSLVLLGVAGRDIELISSIGDSVLAVEYSAGNYKAVVVSDGTVFTNALLNPQNVLNHNYVFSYYIARKLCPRGVILIEGSKYELRLRQPPDGGTPLVVYLSSLNRVLGVSLLIIVLTYVARPRLKPTTRFERARVSEVIGSYEIAKTLCQSSDLSKIFSKECAAFAKTHKTQRLLSAVIAMMKENKEVSDKVLRAIIEKSTH